MTLSGVSAIRAALIGVLVVAGLVIGTRRSSGARGARTGHSRGA